MFGSFKIGSILGITIRVHVLLVVLLALFAFGGSRSTAEVISLALLFPILLLHELGHCLVARKFGLGVLDITLWPLGGMARMTNMPESGRVEGWVAVAGPAVNFVLAALIIPVWMLALMMDERSDLTSILWYALWINIVLGVFNLIPAFPTDGGRILRAIFSRSVDWERATERAVFVGRIFAVLIGVVGLALGNWVAPLLAGWLWWMGALELAQVRDRHRVREQEVPEPQANAFSHAPFDGDFPLRAKRRFTDEDIERLERHRGRLRPFGDGP
ncbi:MAG: site-2 protease family protein [Planctomycetes bacterium]|nr:site-2 protease family protein [Planctomycetota bacterium]